MRLTTLRQLQLDAPSQPGRPAYISAASGLVRLGNRFYVVADDELQLGVFPVHGHAPGSLVPMFAGDLPLPKEERKKRKPDCEALTVLGSFARYPYGALLVLGSGSKSRRRRIALFALSNDGLDADSVRVLDADALYEAAAREVDDLNIEGAFVRDTQLVLMHRGNARHSTCALIGFELTSLLATVHDDDKIGKAQLLSVWNYDLGRIDSVPLTFTDGTLLSDGTLCFSAVAEQADDSYSDGPCVGAAVGTIGREGRLQRVDYLEVPYKVEGIHVERADDRYRVWMVSDADDVKVPAPLLYGELR